MCVCVRVSLIEGPPRCAGRSKGVCASAWMYEVDEVGALDEVKSLLMNDRDHGSTIGEEATVLFRQAVADVEDSHEWAGNYLRLRRWRRFRRCGQFFRGFSLFGEYSKPA